MCFLRMAPLSFPAPACSSMLIALFEQHITPGTAGWLPTEGANVVRMKPGVRLDTRRSINPGKRKWEGPERLPMQSSYKSQPGSRLETGWRKPFAFAERILHVLKCLGVRRGGGGIFHLQRGFFFKGFFGSPPHLL